MMKSLKRAFGVASVLLAVGACTAATSSPEKTGVVTQAFAPGADGVITVTAAGTMLNSYAQVTATTTTTITVNDITTLGAGFGQGSLIMVMQMQGATIDQTDSATYGTITAIGGAGLFEFVHVASVAGNVITLEGACGGLQNTYSVAGHVQVIRVPEPTTLTIGAGASVTGLPWDGTKGGVVALRVSGTTTIAPTGAIDASGLGFRGGMLDQDANLPGFAGYRSTADADGAAKGEGIAGYTAEEYTSGVFGRGAPANGGGGGNAHNGGGGGGANGGLLANWNGQGDMTGTYPGANADPWRLDPAYVANGNKRTTSSGGGRGGYTYAAADQNAVTVAPGNTSWGGDDRREVGGWGGHPLVNGPSASAAQTGIRYFMGGGGGAGDNNNNTGTAGAVGGGIVFLQSTTITGAGAVRANGVAGAMTSGNGNDAPGGGGGGGSIVLAATTVTTITAAANGGAGGKQHITTAESEGPGGGGGGGYIALPATATITTSVVGGANGTTDSPSLTEFPENGATAGGGGNTGVPLTATQLAALSCYSDNAPTVAAPATATTPINTVLTFNGAANTISVADIDARTNPIKVTLTATHGTISLSGTAGLTFTAGTGTLNATMTFTGTVTAIDTALAGLTYHPANNYTGPDALTVLVDDQGNTMPAPTTAKTATATVNINVLQTNHAPVANADTANAVPGVPVAIPVLANDTDADNDTLSVASVTQPAIGHVTINPDGTVTYLAPLGSTGTTTFTYIATDGKAPSAAATVTVTIGGTDSDHDGLPDAYELLIGSDPNDADTDDDGVLDGQEKDPGLDSDGDGLINVLDPDSDNDGLYDGTELGKDCSNPATDLTKHHCIADADPTTTTDPENKDTDGGGVTDGSEDWNLNGKQDTGETDPTATHGADDKANGANKDSDNDGLSDNLEKFLGSDPNDADTDNDGLLDGLEANPADDTDGDGLINVLDADSDNDGLFDGTEEGKDCSNPATDVSKGACIPDADPTTRTSPLIKDTDHGGVSDGSEDVNRNGKQDGTETDPTAGHGADDTNSVDVDTDHDGLSDAFELAIGTNPNDADSDDDGLLDGLEPNPGEDSDGDGLINALDPDSDNDGLYDGTEEGKDCSNPATDLTKHHCIADADPTTKTDPLDRDTDHGGASDGSEDWNLNGKLDANETDPTFGHPTDDSTIVDTDGDGLGDLLEGFLGSNPKDADTDDDGLLDGLEANPADDTDGDGLINVLDVDSDNDALFDGTEESKDCSNPSTDLTKKACIADADPTTHTSPLLRDTDGGGVIDGSEDPNRNGKQDGSETNPTAGHGADDGSAVNVDSDGDGLSDALEASLGSNPNDADSDNDGLLDGDEPNPSQDFDGDGLLNINDPDSDGDGIFDGTEAGKDCSNPATDVTKGNCIADADPTTTTGVLNPDTDHGGVKDGVEDANHNGKVDPGETDPNNKADDHPCATDTTCGATDSGQICSTNSVCIVGCRGTGGNGCPSGQTCTSTTSDPGQCVAGGSSSGSPDGGTGTSSGDGGASSSSGGLPDGGGTSSSSSGALGATPTDDGSLEGGGVSCSSTPGQTGSGFIAALGMMLAVGAATRRRRR